MRSEHRTEVAWIGAALLVLLTPLACQRQQLPSSAVDRYATADQELDFLSDVNDMTAVTNNDALHGLLILADGNDPFASFEERVATAKSRKWMPSGFNAPANESATIGWMAMAGCQICNIKGGVTMHLLGPTPRYCTKELVFMQVIPLRTENQSLTGAEFTDYLNRLHRVRAGAPAEPGSEAATLGGPAGEQSATPMNEANVEETLPSPTP